MNIQNEFNNIPDNDNELTVLGSENLLKLLINNLIDNACKFSDPPKVKMKIAFVEAIVSFQFIDQGIGIPDSAIPKVFEPLYRAPNAGTKRGHGIDLSIIKRIAEIHGATTDIKSELGQSRKR